MSSTLEGWTSSLHCLSSTITAAGRPVTVVPGDHRVEALRGQRQLELEQQPVVDEPAELDRVRQRFSEFRQERTSLSGGFQP
jgi:hypothetical protein